MANSVEVKVPDIGDFSDVPIIEVAVKPGDEVEVDSTLVTLESDKAAMDVPSPYKGVVKEVAVEVGDTVSQGTLILELETAADVAPESSKERVREGARVAPDRDSGAGSYGGASGVYETVEVRVPDIGDFSDVPVIEVMVKAGDTVAVDDALITLESDKASMDVPTPYAGRVKEVAVSEGDSVSEGTLICTLAAQESATSGPAAPSELSPQPESAPDAEAARRPQGEVYRATPPRDADVEAEMLVLGSGPGGYTAAFRAADLGMKAVLVERYDTLGGVCLNVGCIPSKAFLHAAEVIAEVEEMSERGIDFGAPKIDRSKLTAFKNKVVGKLTSGLAGLAKQRKVKVVTGVGRFESSNLLVVETKDGPVKVGFEQAIIAAGSEPTKIPAFPHDDPRVWDSTDALELESIPGRMLVVGGGIIGLEMATVFDALGTKITVVELLDGLMPGVDRDLVRPLEKRIRRRYESIYLGTKVAGMEAGKKGLEVRFEGKGAPESDTFDAVLVSIGRVPNGKRIGAENAGVRVDERGFVPVDNQQRTNVPHIYAIGDIVGQPMLAHKAVHEGKVAAEVAAGMRSGFDARVIPSVAYTDPEVAWMGVTESDAKARGVAYEKGVFPWAASGRSLGLGRDEGMTKLLFDAETHRVIGAGIVGPHAGDLIAETALALEMNADMQDIGLTIHPHPTLSETVCFAAEMAEGTITDLMPPKKKSK